LPEGTFLLLDAGGALPCKHEEVLLFGVAVLEAARRTGLENGNPEAELTEPPRLEVWPEAQHRHVRLEQATCAERLVGHPSRLTHVDDEPAWADRSETGADVFEPGLYRNCRIPT
jgi:hypothetical protein